MNKTRPFLKWAGGKYNCIEKIIASLPEGLRLVEPFGGSGVVFMNAQYSQYLIGETNPHLIAIFKLLQHQGESFIDYCEQYFIPENNQKERYYELRTLFNQTTSIADKSALFLYLNRHGYNGLCRFNSQGIYNVPFGLIKSPCFPRSRMLSFHHKSQQAEFIVSDFRDTFERALPGDVIYCDPPYVPLNNSRDIPYTEKLFTTQDQIELAELAQKTAARGIPVIISNHDTEFTRQHYQKAEITSFKVPRFINCQVNFRQPVKELLAVFK